MVVRESKRQIWSVKKADENGEIPVRQQSKSIELGGIVNLVVWVLVKKYLFKKSGTKKFAEGGVIMASES